MELVLSNMSTQKRRSKPNSQRQHPDDKPSRTTEAQCCLVKHPTKQKAAPIHTNNYTQQLQHLTFETLLRRLRSSSPCSSETIPPLSEWSTPSGQRLGAALTKLLPRSRSDGETARGTAPPGCDCAAPSGPPAARLQRAASRGKEHPTWSRKKPLFFFLRDSSSPPVTVRALTRALMHSRVGQVWGAPCFPPSSLNEAFPALSALFSPFKLEIPSQSLTFPSQTSPLL